MKDASSGDCNGPDFQSTLLNEMCIAQGQPESLRQPEAAFVKARAIFQLGLRKVLCTYSCTGRGRERQVCMLKRPRYSHWPRGCASLTLRQSGIGAAPSPFAYRSLKHGTPSEGFQEPDTGGTQLTQP